MPPEARSATTTAVVTTPPQPGPRRRSAPSDDFEESDDGVDGGLPSPAGAEVEEDGPETAPAEEPAP